MSPDEMLDLLIVKFGEQIRSGSSTVIFVGRERIQEVYNAARKLKTQRRIMEGEHLRPSDGKKCDYLATEACNKCGWTRT